MVECSVTAKSASSFTVMPEATVSTAGARNLVMLMPSS